MYLNSNDTQPPPCCTWTHAVIFLFIALHCTCHDSTIFIFIPKSMVDKPHRDKQSSDWATGCPMAHHPALMASSNQQQLKYEMFWEVNKKWTQYLQQHLVKIPPKRRNVFSWVSQTGYLIEKSQIRGNWSSWIRRSEWM
jgi:hypothetical protein